MNVSDTRSARAQEFSPAEAISWVGDGRTAGEICLGTETGRIRFLDEGLAGLPEAPSMPNFEEAINGAVFLDSMAAITTRDRLAVLRGPKRGGLWSYHDGGSHGVVAGGTGMIVATMGAEGILSILSRSDGSIASHIITPSGLGEIYHYKTAYLGRDELNHEVFATACRTGGLILNLIGSSRSGQGKQIIRRALNPMQDAKDVVDVCSVRSRQYSLAVAVLTMDGMIHISRDPRKGQFATMRPHDLQGTPYSIQSTGGHIFVLTSDYFYGYHDIIGGLLGAEFDDVHSPRGLAIDNPVNAFRDAVDAVGFAVLNGRRVAIVLEDRVRFVDIKEMFRGLASRTATPRQRARSIADVNLIGTRQPILDPRGASSRFSPPEEVSCDIRPMALIAA